MKSKIQNEIIKLINKHIEKKGLNFTKKIKDSYRINGFLISSHVPAEYSKKIAFSLKECDDLVKDGYYLDDVDVGTFLLNAFIAE